jgi:hypothetical protein
MEGGKYMNEYVICILLAFVSSLIGFVFGRFGLKHHHDGSIVLEMTEDGERERVRFVLGLDLDQLEDRHQVTLKIENNLSKK